MQRETLIERTIFNAELLILNKSIVRQLRLDAVTKPNIMEYNSAEFAHEGLYSTTIFGQPGSPARKNKFAYIDLKLPIIHPFVYKQLVKLKGIYDGILAGRTYAIFDPETRDFIASTPEKGGRTGYDFFIEHLSELELSDNDSYQRHGRVELVKRYATKEKLMDCLLVIPPAYREYKINKRGLPEEDEINKIYRKFISQSNYLANAAINEKNRYLYDTSRYLLQKYAGELVDYVMTLLDGKNKFTQGNWASRKVNWGSRNVASPMKLNIKDLDDTRNLKSTNTILGVYQATVCLNPVFKPELNKKFISHFIFPNQEFDLLVDKDSLKTTQARVDRKEKEKWLTSEGLDTVIQKVNFNYIKGSPVKVGDYYMCLVLDKETTVEVVYNTDSVKEEDRQYLRPITYIELFYITLVDIIQDYPGFVTRYPVVEQGSIYPSIPYLMSTIKGRDVEIKLHDKTISANEYPILNQDFVRTISPHNSRLDGLKCDFDGDELRFNMVFTEEARKEILETMNNPKFYLNATGSILASMATLPLELTIKHMCSRRKN